MTDIVVIDNYDSFTYNIVAYCKALGANVKVLYNDVNNISNILQCKPNGIIISPGPGNTKDAGISMDVIDYFHKKLPIFGICLGHQCIAEYFGASIIEANRVMHGKNSDIIINNNRGLNYKINLFEGIEQNISVTRYHSLIVDSNDFINNSFNDLYITAYNIFEKNVEIMAIAHRIYPICGVQFHPEAVLTQQGHQVINNFLKYLDYFNN